MLPLNKRKSLGLKVGFQLDQYLPGLILGRLWREVTMSGFNQTIQHRTLKSLAYETRVAAEIGLS
jgi:hypothetical protein